MERRRIGDHCARAEHGLLTPVEPDRRAPRVGGHPRGDEVVALWPAEETGGPVAAVHWAVRTAMAVGAGQPSRACRGYPIRLRAGIGTVRQGVDIGRERGRHIFVAVGPALGDMARAQKAVAASETGLSEAARSLLGETAGVETPATHSSVGRLITVTPLPGSPPVAPRPGSPSRPVWPPAICRTASSTSGAPTAGSCTRSSRR